MNLKKWIWDVPYLTAKGLAAYYMGHVEPFHASSPLKDQITSEVSRRGIRVFIETGTFRGDSLRWVAEHFPNVECHSVDINPLYTWLTRVRLRKYKNVHLHTGDSTEFIKHFLPSLVGKPTLFWLDAHWLHDLPLNNELQAIYEICPDPSIFIDDWKGNYFANMPIDLESVPYLKGLQIQENVPEHFCFIVPP